MNNLLRCIFAPLIFLLFNINITTASHIAGGEITLESMGIGTDMYTVTLDYYYDCSSSFNPGLLSKQVTLTSSCTTPQTLTLPVVITGGTEISQICPSQLGNSQCSGGTLPGMIHYQYQTTVSLPLDCSDYTFSFSEAVRNPSVNVTNSGNFYIEATLNTILFPDNSTPEFTAQPIPYVCLGQTVNYNYGVVENDGDSLKFELIAAKTSATGTLTYGTGYSATAPIVGITIDQFTGELSFSPGTPTGNYIVTLLVTEYNGVSQVISTVQRDIQFVVINCSNQIPSPPVGGISNFSILAGTPTLTNSTTVTASPGDEFCFDVVFTDVNATDILTLSSNVTSALSGATFTQTGLNPATGTICWLVPTGVNLNTNNPFIVTALDTACPVSGSNSIAFNVIVPQNDPLTGTLVTTNPSCNGANDGTATVTATGGIGPYQYIWIPQANVVTGLGTNSITAEGGNFQLIVLDLGDPDPSTNTWTTNFSLDDPAPVSITPIGVTDDDCDPTTCTGVIQFIPGADPSFTSVTLDWSDIGTSTATPSIFAQRNGLCAGTYTLTVTDGNSCSAVEEFVINEPSPIIASFDPIDVIDVSCFGGTDGEATVSIEQTCGPSTQGCNGSSTLYVLGTDNTTNTTGSYPTPYGGINFGVRNQFLYTAAELTALGMSAGPIESIGFDVATVGSISSLNNFEIKMGCTNVSDLNAGWETGLTTVFTPSSLSPTVFVSSGVNTHVFTTAYMWDGTSNIVVEICYNNTFSLVNGNSEVRYTPTTNNSVRYYGNDNSTVCSSNLLSGLSTNRPNTRFQACGNSYSYSWTPAPATGQNETASNLSANTYTVTVTNQEGCTDTEQVIIDEPDQFLVSQDITLTQAILCNGDCNAQIDINVAPNGGTAPFTYSWSTGNAGVNLTSQSGLCAGTYTVTLTDALNCSDTAQIVIEEPDAILSGAQVVDVLCFGDNTGSITLNPTGGTGAGTYIFNWSTNVAPNSLTGSSVSSLLAGNYTVTITDGNNCTKDTTITISQPLLPLSVNLIQTSFIQCNGDCTGAVNAIVTGGTGPFNYNWSNGSSGSGITSLSNLCAGNYSVTVTDANGCTATNSIPISEPDEIFFNLTQTTFIQCHGDCTAEVTSNIVGGTPGYTILWSTGSNSANLTGLCAGSYTISVTDANNCTKDTTIIITEPDEIMSGAVVTDILCNGDNTGAISLNTTGGTAGYSFNWSANVAPNSLTGSSVSNLFADTYTVTITDANNCTKDTTIVISEPTVLDVNINLIIPILCGGDCTGEIEAVATGGTPGPTGYSYIWNTGVPGNFIGSLCAASYTVTVTDANGCTASETFNLPEPTPLSVSGSVTNPSCNGGTGSILISASGGTVTGNYSATCSASNGGVCPIPLPTFNAGILTVSNLVAGDYIISVFDDNNCSVDVVFSIIEPDPIMSGAQVSVAGCSGTITLNPTGGTTTVPGPTGYSYNWSIIPNPGTSTVSGLSNGAYTVTITDDNGCTKDTTINIALPGAMSIAINEIQSISCNGVCDGQLQASVMSGGTGPFSYSWSTIPDPGTDTTFSNLCDGTYTVTVTDGNNCTATASYTLSEPSLLNASIDAAASNIALSCNGDNNGTIVITASGGTVAGTYTATCSSLGNNCPATLPGFSGNTLTISNLVADVYTITVFDDNGCSTDVVVTITEPDPINSGASTVNVSCNGASTGSISLNPSGGAGPGTYSFNWSANVAPNPLNGSSVSNLAAGTYTVTITDGNNCTKDTTIAINEPLQIIFSAPFALQNASCNGACDGVAILPPPYGGTGNVTFLWSNGDQTPIADSLCAGTHTVTVTDANNCVETATVTITEPSGISLVGTNSSNVFCNGGSDGSITLVTAGGTPGYTYAWSANTLPNPGNDSLAVGLSAGSYTVTITDLNGCSKDTTITITEPNNPIVTSPSITDVACNGDNSGSITLNVTGGTAGYSYNWTGNPLPIPNPGNNPSATGLFAGTYTVTITDGNNCTKDTTITISEPSAITPTITVVNATCGQSDGSIGLAPVNGGTGNYTYSWSTNIVPNPGNVDNVSGLAAGAYTVTITDNNGCTSEHTIPVSNSNGPTGASFVVTDATCNTDCDGALSVTPIGGVTPYSFTWSVIPDPGDVSSVSGLCAGTYIVTIEDANGCQFIGVEDVGEPDPIQNFAQITDESCLNSCNGQIDLVTTIGGNGTYTYLWDDGSSNNPRTGLCSGTYTVTTTDGVGCTVVESFNVGSGAIISIVIVGTDPSCNGGCNGTATATPSGGVPTYTYAWSSGGGSNIETGLCAGTYTVTVTDANGCSGTQTVTINDPDPISFDNVAVTDPTCGNADGEVTITTSGGSGNITYTWNGTPVTSPIQNVSAGLYTLVATDDNGCTASINIPVNDIGAPNISVSGVDAGCSGACIGSATVTVPTTGGPFGILWNTTPPLTTPTINNLCAGSYGVAVVDISTGCIAADTITINELSGPIVTLNTSDNANCGGVCSGNITAVVSGGVPPYTYVWDNGITDTDSIVDSLCGGTYNVTVTDANGCSSIESTTINDVPALTISIDNVVGTTCPNSNDGSIDLSVQGGASPITYNWVGSGFTAATEDISNILPGTYYITVTDGGGCSYIDSIDVTSNSTLAINPTDSAVCEAVENVTFYANATGTINPTYNWTLLTGGTSLGTGSSLTQSFFLGDTLEYLVFVTDNGCVVSDTARVRSGQLPDIDAGPTRTIVKGESVAIGGNPAIPFAMQSITWTPSISLNDNTDPNPIASPQETTLYTLSVVTLVGCEATDTVTVIVNEGFDYSSGFSPNGDGVNDVWNLPFLDRYPDSQVEVYNRWGQLVFSSEIGYPFPWDGTYEGADAPIGTYYYVIDLGNEDVTKPITGPITIMR